MIYANAMCDTTCPYCLAPCDPVTLCIQCSKHGVAAPIGKLCLDMNVSDDQKGDMNGANNQAIKADAGKSKLTLVPRRIIWDIAAIREYGNNKYPEGGPDNWKQVDAQRYKDALYRHLMYYLDDQYGFM